MPIVWTKIVRRCETSHVLWHHTSWPLLLFADERCREWDAEGVHEYSLLLLVVNDERHFPFHQWSRILPRKETSHASIAPVRLTKGNIAFLNYYTLRTLLSNLSILGWLRRCHLILTIYSTRTIFWHERN